MKFQFTIPTVALLSVLFLVGLSVSSPAQEKNAEGSQHGAKFQPFNVKTGLWESTTVWKTAGEMPIPPGMLERMTPEQRARFEERMKASSGANAHTLTEKHCVTQQELQKPIDFSNKQCTWNLVESTSSKASGNVSCDIQGMKMAGKGEYEAPDQEHMKGWHHLTSTGGGHNMTVDSTFTSKWLGASCGSIK
jgi:hypothetical protein